LREYLLGRLAEDQAAELDERLFCEDSSHDELVQEQEALLDDFVYNRLPTRDRLAYVRQVERSAELQAQIAERRRLIAAVGRLPNPVGAAPRARFVFFLAPALALLLCVASALYFRELRAKASLQAQVVASAQPAQPTSAPLAQGEPAVAFLSANVTRSGSALPVVDVAHGASLLELQVEVHPSSAAQTKWDAELMRDGEVMWASKNVLLHREGNEAFLDLMLDTRSLNDGAYEVRYKPQADGGTSQTRMFVLRLR
jgi:hypothetical protein